MFRINYKKLSEDLGDIPTKNDVIKLCRYIESIKWFKPQKEPNKKLLSIKVNSVLKAFKLDFSCELEFHKLEKNSDWASARDSAWDSAWASAWASAWDSAWDSAWASTFEVVKDLMKIKGYDKNPFKELLKIWAMGLYPVGLLKDKKFHIYYVPLEKKNVIELKKQ